MLSAKDTEEIDFQRFHVSLFELVSWAAEELLVDEYIRWTNYYHSCAFKANRNAIQSVPPQLISAHISALDICNLNDVSCKFIMFLKCVLLLHFNLLYSTLLHSC